MDTRAFPCNMIVTDGRNVCVVKDTCEGCKYDKDFCAIHDMLGALHMFENWEKWDMPTFRERLKEGRKCKQIKEQEAET